MAAEESTARLPVRGRRLAVVIAGVGLVAAAWLWALLTLLGTELRRIPSESMAPTYTVGDRILVDTGAYDDADPEIGDVVVFHPPSGAELGARCGVEPPPGSACPEPTPDGSDIEFIKRVVAGPGDALSMDR